MGYPNISQGTGRGRRAGALFGGTVLIAAATGLSAAGTAHAASAPTADLAFSAATVAAGTKPQLTFISRNVPSGAVLFLEESANGGRQWKTVDKTTNTQGTASLTALSEGIYEFKIVITSNKATIGASAPAALTVTGADGAQPSRPPAPAAPAPPPAPGPAAAPSGSGVPWLQIIVEPIWDAIAGAIMTLILSLF